MGLEAAVRYLDSVGIESIEQHEHELTAYALATLSHMPGVRIIGPESSVDRGSAISFVVDGLHPHDVGQVLDDRGVAVRVGHHCAWPTCRRYGVPATTRLSTYLYNDTDDIDAAQPDSCGSEFLGGMSDNVEALYQEIILDHSSTRVGRACLTTRRGRVSRSTRPAAMKSP